MTEVLDNIYLNWTEKELPQKKEQNMFMDYILI